MTRAPRSQTALEYLITYGWLILIITIVLAALLVSGIFNLNSLVGNTCAFPADFGCSSTSLASNGLLSVSIVQDTHSPINITGIACDSNQSLIHLVHISPAAYLGSGGNYTAAVQCYASSSAFSGPIGSIYHGFIIINYTDLSTAFRYTSVGTVVLKVNH